MENSNLNQSTQKKQMQGDQFIINHHIWWMIVIVALIVLAGIGAVSLSMKKSTKMSEMQTQAVTPKPTAVPVLGSLSLSSLTTQARVGQTARVGVVGDSAGKIVAGFDILISYDPQQLSVISVTPLRSDFQVSSYTKRKGEISITGTVSGVSSSGSQSSPVFSKSNLLYVSFSPLKTGQATLEIKPTIQNERTKFIDTNFHEYMPTLNSLQLEIL